MRRKHNDKEKFYFKFRKKSKTKINMNVKFFKEFFLRKNIHKKEFSYFV